MLLLDNMVHVLSTYSNRWGGPRYRTISLHRFLTTGLSEKQNKDLDKGQKINSILVSNAFLTAEHRPLYLKSLQYAGEKETYLIKDELGFEAKFAKGVEILIWCNSCQCPEYIKIEDIQEGMERVINFEQVPELNTDFKHKFLFITSSNIQDTMCDGINSNILLNTINSTMIKKQDELDKKNNVQEIHLLRIEEVRMVDLGLCYKTEFLPFSYVLEKDKTTNKTKYSNKISQLRKKKYLDKMRGNVYNIKKDKYKVKLEMIDEKDNH